jgi:MFS family permease
MPTSPATETAAAADRSRRFAWFTLPPFLRPDPPAAYRVTDPEAIRRGFLRGQVNVLCWATIGYALFYFVRNNMGIAMPVMGKQLGIGKEQLGLFLTLHGVIYGVSKFANGFIGDRANARTFMAVGLILSAACNLIFGLSSTAVVLGLVWMFNGWFQGMGFPPAHASSPTGSPPGSWRRACRSGTRRTRSAPAASSSSAATSPCTPGGSASSSPPAWRSPAPS